MELVKIISWGLVLFFLRISLWPIFGMAADAIWLGLSFYLPRTRSPLYPLHIILLGSLLIDLISSYYFPFYIFTTIIAWYIYSEIIEPRLLFMTGWSRLLSLVLWLFLWRLTRLLLVTAFWLVQKKAMLAPSNLGLTSWWEWVLGAVIVWLVWEGYNRFRFRSRQPS